MRMCVFYDADGPNGSQFAINPREVVAVYGDDGEEDSAPRFPTEGDMGTRIILRDGCALHPCGSLASVVLILEGSLDALLRADTE